VAQQAVAKVSAAYKLDGREMRISACAGVSFHGDVDFDDALRRADIALMMRSVRCAEAFPFFFRADRARRSAAHRDRANVARAWSRKRDSTRLQSIFDLQSLQLSSFEALARWRPELGWISPSEFIPISEQIRLLQELSETLLTRAAAAARWWPKAVSSRSIQAQCNYARPSGGKASLQGKRARTIAKQKPRGNPRAACLSIQPQNVRIALRSSFQQEVEMRQVCRVSNAIGARLWCAA
jgi:hypothetical protein